MAEGIVYLDVDDEITSAAQRIRSALGTKVALVVPYGSRIATSRMNFRLLSREAVVSNRRLAIVSGEAAARSLAASAGLPVFGSVAEYEAALATGSAAGSPGAAPSGEPGPADGAAAVGGAGLLAASATVAATGPVAASPAAMPDGAAPDASEPPATRKSQRPKRPVPDETTAVQTGAWALPESATDPVAVARAASPGGSADARAPLSAAPESGASVADDEIAGRRSRLRPSVFVPIALLGLTAVVLAVGGYLLLPAATIDLAPRREAISIDLPVAADPAATAVDVNAGIVPAHQLSIPVKAAKTFTTTGTHVETTAAKGSVTFTNYDFLGSNSIPSGSIVSTESGVRFRTVDPVLLPPATRLGTTIVPTTKTVGVNAVKPGTAGNVPANAIRLIPPGEDPNSLSVNNGSPTSGGNQTTTPEVSQAEVDKAVAELKTQVQTAFADALASGAGAPPGTTVFPATAIPGNPVPNIDPKSLVGTAVATFDLKMTATGTVIAVDPTPVRTIAEARLTAQVKPGHRLVPNSTQIAVGDGTVGEDGSVTFAATAQATEVAIVDEAAVRSLVKGRTPAEARAALAPFGDATVSIWPDWASTVPSIDARLTITIADGGAAPAGTSPAPSAGDSPLAPSSSWAPSPSRTP